MLNIHSHKLLSDAVYNIRYGIDDGARIDGEQLFSVGIHPWDAAKVSADESFEHAASLANFIGECGLDKPCGIPIYIQQQIFEQQITIAERLHKPMIIHCVGMYGRLLELRKRSTSPTWIIHGCYASKEWIREAAKYAVAFSLGMRELQRPRAAEIIRAIPIERLFLETDEGDNIEEVYNLAAEILKISAVDLETQIAHNFRLILNPL